MAIFFSSRFLLDPLFCSSFFSFLLFFLFRLTSNWYVMQYSCTVTWTHSRLYYPRYRSWSRFRFWWLLNCRVFRWIRNQENNEIKHRRWFNLLECSPKVVCSFFVFFVFWFLFLIAISFNIAAIDFSNRSTNSFRFICIGEFYKQFLYFFIFFSHFCCFYICSKVVHCPRNTV